MNSSSAEGAAQPPTRVVRPLSSLVACRAIQRLAWRRVLRDKSTWISVVLALFPVVFILVVGTRWSPQTAWYKVVNTLFVPLFAILPPLTLAPLIAEEAQKQTYTFLWSRPIPRWTIVAGKAAVLFPLVMLLLLVSAAACWWVLPPLPESGYQSILWLSVAVVLGVLAAGSVSITVGVFLPRQAVAAAVAYLLVVDLSVGSMPLSIASVSISHHIKNIAGTGDADADRLTSMTWLLAITALALIATLWRVRRVELGKSS